LIIVTTFTDQALTSGKEGFFSYQIMNQDTLPNLTEKRANIDLTEITPKK